VTLECGSATATPYFVSYMIIVNMIFLNLFIAIILEGFSNSSEAENMRIKEDSGDLFIKKWLPFDRVGEGRINTDDLEEFMYEIIIAEI
jgi:hypothetical protein